MRRGSVGERLTHLPRERTVGLSANASGDRGGDRGKVVYRDQPIKEFDQLVRVTAIKARSTGNGGDVAYLDIDDRGERTVRVVVHYLTLPD